MRLRRWFLPDVPDVVGMLRSQAEISVECIGALVDWTRGDADAAGRLRDAEQRAGRCKRELWRALRSAFSTPVDPEDLYSLSFLLDEVLSGAHHLVRESEALDLVARDAPSADMAAVIRDGVIHLGEAFAVMADDAERATHLADEARHVERRIEHLYTEVMASVRALDDVRQLWARTQHYARFNDLAARVARVSDRVWYAVVKEA